MPSTALFVHVPVDKIVIINGPGPKWLVQAIGDLNTRLTAPHANGTVYTEMEFTLRTGASDSTFRRKLKVTAFDISDLRRDDFGGLDKEYSFVARLNGHAVFGYYNPKGRTGFFRPI